MSKFQERLNQIMGEQEIRLLEPMASHTTFRAGGAADFYLSPTSLSQLISVVNLCREETMPYFMIGNGSNLLVSDKGYHGVMISLEKGFRECFAEGDTIRAGAGMTLYKIAREARNHSLAGFEFAAGIPGTLGGAIVMNAGAYGSEISHVLKEAKVLTPKGQVLTLSVDELEFGYRTSCILKQGYIVLEGVITLTKGDQEQIKARTEELSLLRRTKQPLEFPSAGSTFKRPPGRFAGQLIEQAGLKGLQVGGAQVSEKHGGFVINKNHATADDIMKLCQEVQKRVKDVHGIDLELEVKTLGEF